jgi:hypothetical protein
MKFTGLVTGAFAAVAVAVPTAVPAEATTEATNQGGCSVGFVFARGSTEPSPLVSLFGMWGRVCCKGSHPLILGAKGILIGPSLQSSLKSKIPGMQTFPVLYAASLTTNISNDRTDAASIAKGVEAFQKAAGCSVLIAGGYSQGAAVVRPTSSSTSELLR